MKRFMTCGKLKMMYNTSPNMLGNDGIYQIIFIVLSGENNEAI